MTLVFSSADRKQTAGLGEGSRLLGLDGLRGYAAICVMLHHFIGISDMGFSTRSAFIGVDLFFIMSGLVLAMTYEDRLRSGALSLQSFMRSRFIRLYPIYFASLLVAVAVALSYGILFTPNISAGWIAYAAASGLVLVPTWNPYYNELLPLVPPAWSLFFEFWGNLIFAALLCRASLRQLAAVTGVAMAIYIVVTLASGQMELGIGRIRAFPFGIFRFLATFGTGVLIWRLRDRIPSLGWARAPLTLIVLALAFPLLPEDRVVLFAWIIVVFPLALVALAQLRPVGGVAALCAHAGRMSYPLYLVHWPIMVLVIYAFPKPAATVARPWTAELVAVSLCLAVTWLLAYILEPPLRRGVTWMIDRLSPDR